jgi:hypothetical protein
VCDHTYMELAIAKTYRLISTIPDDATLDAPDATDNVRRWLEAKHIN